MNKKLVNMNIEEVSLVDKPANRKKFNMIKNSSKSRRLIVKRGEIMDKLKEKFKKYLGDDLDFEDFSKRKIPQKEYDNISKILDLLEEYKDMFPSDLQGAVDYLIQNILVVEKVEKIMEIKTFEELEKSIQGLKEVPADNETIQKNIDFLKELLKPEDKDNKDDKDDKNDKDDKINKDNKDDKDDGNDKDDGDDKDKIVKAIYKDIVEILKKNEIRIENIENQSKGRISTDDNTEIIKSSYPTLEKNWG